MTTKDALFTYLLRQADLNLILGHRVSEWCGHGPVLEQDIALINTALDILGQAKSLYNYAAEYQGEGKTEDDLAYLRIEREYLNPLICEQPNGHFGDTIARQFFVDAFQYLYYQELKNSKNEFLSAFAEKSLKEVTYHLRFSSEWLTRLGDGTEESHNKMQEAVEDIWSFTGELFEMDDVENTLVSEGIAVDMASLKDKWFELISDVLTKATLTVPEKEAWMISGGRTGKHTEYLGYILADLQYLQRAYPNASW